MRSPQIIVIDDDPTGSQTVHSCLLLLNWELETLKRGLGDPSPIFFILTNSRGRSPAEADRVTREVCRNLKRALAEAGIDNFLLVSRSDSTLRGHYPLETDAIAAELGPFDAHFLVPAFFEAGRITLDGTHYIEAGGDRTPVHATEFAQDPAFGFRSSYLPDYVAEKTQGRIATSQVQRLGLAELRAGTADRLQGLTGNVCLVVDGERQADLDRFAEDLLRGARRGKRFLLRSAASLLTSLANLPPQPVPPPAMAQYRQSPRPGVVLVGSYTQTTTQQLARLLEQPDVVGIELDLTKLGDVRLGDARLGDVRLADVRLADAIAPAAPPPGSDAVTCGLGNDVVQAMAQAALAQIAVAQAANCTAVVYTSRQVLSFETAAARLSLGRAVSQLFTFLLRNLPEIGFLITKGGITSNDSLSQGLELSQVRLLGQILPGISLVQLAPDHPRFPLLPVVLFPGNVGQADSLTLAHKRIAHPQDQLSK